MPGLDLGIDMGTSQVIIALPGRGVVLKEPSVIAVDKADGHIIACGSEAYDMPVSYTHLVQRVRRGGGFVCIL